MRAWIAKDENGFIFAYQNEPHIEDGIWWGDAFATMQAIELPIELKVLLEQKKAVYVDLTIIITSYRIIS